MRERMEIIATFRKMTQRNLRFAKLIGFGPAEGLRLRGRFGPDGGIFSLDGIGRSARRPGLGRHNAYLSVFDLRRRRHSRGEVSTRNQGLPSWETTGPAQCRRPINVDRRRGNWRKQERPVSGHGSSVVSGSFWSGARVQPVSFPLLGRARRIAPVGKPRDFTTGSAVFTTTTRGNPALAPAPSRILPQNLSIVSALTAAPLRTERVS